MTTQTTNLLFQTTGANASAPRSASPDRLADSARNNGAFGATLSRELAARQQPQQPQAAQQSKPAPQQQSKPNAADKPANREPVREQARTPAKPASHEGETKTAKSASAEGTEEAGADASATEGAAEAAAAATTPVTDMLAFMASLTKPTALDAAAVPVDAAAAGEQQLKALASALEHMTGATASVGDDAAATGAAAVTDELGKGVTLASGVQRAPVDPNAPQAQAQAGALPEGQQDGAQFQAQLRESQQGAIPAAEEAPAPLAQLQAQAAKMADAVGNPAAVPGDRIPARVGSQGWDNQISQRIVYMVGKEQAATLTLNPPDLGPVQIVLNVSNDQASVAFSAEQLEVRQALENALPRLREMMSESGIALNNATVDAGARQQQQDSERRTPGSNGGNGNLAGNGTGNEGEAAVNEMAPRTRTVGLGDRGMVDLFA